MEATNRNARTVVAGLAGWALALAGLTGSGALSAATVRVDGAPEVRVAAQTSPAPQPATRIAPDLDIEPGAFGVHYIACIRDVGGSADTAEHWSSVCEQRAIEEAVRERQCIENGAATPDAMERRSASCAVSG